MFSKSHSRRDDLVVTTFPPVVVTSPSSSSSSSLSPLVSPSALALVSSTRLFSLSASSAAPCSLSYTPNAACTQHSKPSVFARNLEWLVTCCDWRRWRRRVAPSPSAEPVSSSSSSKHDDAQPVTAKGITCSVRIRRRYQQRRRSLSRVRSAKRAIHKRRSTSLVFSGADAEQELDRQLERLSQQERALQCELEQEIAQEQQLMLEKAQRLLALERETQSRERALSAGAFVDEHDIDLRRLHLHRPVAPRSPADAQALLRVGTSPPELLRELLRGRELQLKLRRLNALQRRKLQLTASRSARTRTLQSSDALSHAPRSPASLVRRPRVGAPPPEPEPEPGPDLGGAAAALSPPPASARLLAVAGRLRDQALF